MNLKQTTKKRGNSRRSGSVIIYTAAGIVAFLGVAALSVDMGFLYTRRAEAQKAADAAALAGASTLFQPVGLEPDRRSLSVRLTEAKAKALEYARLNGYDVANGATVEGYYPASPAATTTDLYFRVKLGRPEPLFFGRIFTRSTTRPVEAAATAVSHMETRAIVGTPISGEGEYGIANGTINLSLFGPDGFYEHGDPYSTRYSNRLFDSGPKVANPRFVEGQGVTFDLNFAADYTARFGTQAQVEIFDPDTYNNGSNFAERGSRVDEIRAGWSPSIFTTTKYILQSVDAATGTGLREEAAKTFGNDPTTDMKWVADDAFRFNYDPSRRYQFKVVTTDGTSENGFDLRVGPPHNLTDTEWNREYRTAAPIVSQGRLPINFTDRQRVRLALGYVPREAANGNVIIKKFDNDVGGTDIQYFAEGWRSNIPGTLSLNGEWTTDTVQLPAEYPGAFWFAEYTASAQDTSAWELTYDGPAVNPPPTGLPNIALVE